MDDNPYNTPQDKKCFIKLVVIGDSGVGKSSLIHYFQKGTFSESFKPTIGADFANKDVVLDDRRCVLQIWDTAGQERFQSLSAAFYRGADCCCLVYDITKPDSFEHLTKWKDHFMSRSTPKKPELFPFVVLGNKADLDNLRRIETSLGEQYAKENGEMLFFETSAKDSTNVETALLELTKKAIRVQDLINAEIEQ